MEALYSHELAKLVSGLEHKEYLKAAGRVEALETMYHLIDTLDQTERQLNEHRSRATDAKRDTDQRIRTQRDLALAGSPWFDIARKPRV